MQLRRRLPIISLLACLALSAAGVARGEALVIAGYVDQGGSGILRGALDTGAFSTFVFPDGMVGGKLETDFGKEVNGSFGQMPSSEGEGKDKFLALATAAGFDGTGVYSGEAYDAASLIMLSMARPTTRARKMTKVLSTPWINAIVTMSPLATCAIS